MSYLSYSPPSSLSTGCIRKELGVVCYSCSTTAASTTVQSPSCSLCHLLLLGHPPTTSSYIDCPVSSSVLARLPTPLLPIASSIVRRLLSPQPHIWQHLPSSTCANGGHKHRLVHLESSHGAGRDDVGRQWTRGGAMSGGCGREKRAVVARGGDRRGVGRRRRER